MTQATSTGITRPSTPDWLTTPIEFEDQRSFQVCRTVLRLVVGIGFAGLLWAGLAPIRELSIARGQLTPVSLVRPVQHLEGGIVEQILAEQGQVVDKDQPLMVLRAVTAEADLSSLNARIINLRLQKERLEALIAGRAPDFAAAGDANPSLVAEYLQAYHLRVDHRAKERRLLLARIAQRKAEVAGLNNEIATQRRLMDIQQHQLEARRQLVAGGSVSHKQVLEVETTFEQARVLLQASEGKLAAAKEALSETEAALAELDAQANKLWAEELAKVSSELTESKETNRKHVDRVDRLTVRAPARGRVQHVLQRSPGEVVRPGEAIAQIVPIGEALVAEVHVKTEDIAVIKVGNAAEVKVTAYDFAKFGKLKGHVASISPSTFELEDKRSYYKAIIHFHPKDADGIGAWKLQPGMTVEADIISGSRSLLQYLLKPVYRGVDIAFSER